MTRRFSPLFDVSVHTERTRLGDLHQAQIWGVARPSPTEGEICQQHILRRKDAEEWALETERRIDRGEPSIGCGKQGRSAISIRLHRADLQEVGKRMGRSKTASLIFLEKRLGRFKLPELDRERLIQFGKERAREGAGPVTLGIDLGYIKTILSHAAAVHGIVLHRRAQI